MSTADTLGQPLATERYHSLDGLRASMMLLGIFLHAAWFFVPVWFGHPITDVSANWGIAHFFFWVHLFRMQAFFLVAGFFAHLLIQKRGLWRFFGNRGMRIAIPFLLFTIILFPLMLYQCIAGGLLSGRIQTSLSTWNQFVEELSKLKLSEVWPFHFWFLYCLVLLYGISLILLFVIRFVFDRHGLLRQRLQNAIAHVVSTPWGVPLFALPIAALLYWNVDWFGIDAGPMKPRWTGVFAYWIFFAVGWCMHVQPALLRKFDRGWAWRLATGTALGLLLSVLFYAQVVSGRAPYIYPLLGDTDIRDYGLLRQQLVRSQHDESHPMAAHVWENMSPEYQRFVTETAAPTSDQLAGIALELSMTAIVKPVLVDNGEMSSLDLSSPWRDVLNLPPDQRSPQQMMELNRKVIESVFAPTITSYWPAPLWYKVGYLYCYALCSWLLVFGCLGFFNYVCSQTSPLFRYLADSSYWLYIVHLPLQFQVQLWISQWQLHWLPKVAIYVAVPTLLGLVSYHFLVRSTFLGWMLIGRRYPLTL
jgi:peptidoglycan/LPS O-acetylase OafA/YrhL